MLYVAQNDLINKISSYPVSDIKLSTLDYALLPSTQVAIHSFDMRMPLEVTVEMMQEFPFIKGIKASLSAIPSCRVRVTPLSENSGLRGVDLGSLPVLNDWIQDALHESLEEYLTPSYIAFDLKSLWYGDPDAPFLTALYIIITRWRKPMQKMKIYCDRGCPV